MALVTAAGTILDAVTQFAPERVADEVPECNGNHLSYTAEGPKCPPPVQEDVPPPACESMCYMRQYQGSFIGNDQSNCQKIC